jgi:adenylate kinase family enzyme
VYLDKTVPLLEYYADREWMFTVDGAQPPDAVHEDIVACLQGWRTSLRTPGRARV